MTKMTIKDIAREAGVSTATVSRVLNRSGYVSDDVKQKVLAVVTKFNYQPNAIARSLKQDKSRSIGIVLPDMTNPYFMKMARAIQRRCFEEGYHLLFVDTEENEAKESEALSFLLEKRVEALVIAGTGGSLEQINAIKEAGICILLADRRLPIAGIDVVAEDSYEAVKGAIAYLADRKHTRIAVVSGPDSIVTARERREGALAGMQAAELSLPDELAVEGDFTRASGTAAIRRLMQLAEPPTAVFSANNEMTFGIYLGLRELGLPLDCIEVVSFGELDFSSLFHNKLSVILQEPDRMGETLGELLVRRLGSEAEGSESRIFVPRLVPFAEPFPSQPPTIPTRTGESNR